MDGGLSSRTKLLVALGKKNEQMRLTMSNRLSRSLKVLEADPDFIPSGTDNSSDSDDSFEPTGSKVSNKTSPEGESAHAIVLDELVDSVVAGDYEARRKPSELPRKLLVRKVEVSAVESDEQITAAVADCMGELVECVAEGKAYECGVVRAEKTFTKKGQPRKRKRFDESPAIRKQKKLEEAVESHKVLPPCKSPPCKLRCSNVINEDRRQAINTGFWALSHENRRAFAIKSQRKLPKARSRLSNPNDSRRVNTFQYLLTDSSGNDVIVCKVFFLTTLGYDKKNDSIVKYIRPSVSAGEVMPILDRRGHHPNNNKVDREPIVSHIMSFNPTISHYRRAHAPNRLYLPSDITIRVMHKCFKESLPDLGEKVSYELYRQEVSKLHISFTKLGHEECFDCEVFRLHSSSNEGHSRNELADDCEPCQQWKSHHEKYKKTRIEYQDDADKEWSPDKLIVSADLQKVIMLPRADMFKEVIFIPRIIAFNESFVPVGSTATKNKSSDDDNKPMAVIWHEGISGRKKSDIASAFHVFLLKNRDKKFITIWLDNCAAQNKNWALFSFFIYMLNSCNAVSLEILELKYFEAGHTFMSADAFHHQVEQSMSQRPKIYDFNDFANTVRAANSSRTYVHEMGVEDFLLDLKDFKSTAKLNKLDPKPLLPEFVSVRFQRGKNCLQYKNDYSEQYKELNYLTAAVFKNGVPQPESRTTARGVDTQRKQNLITKLRPIIPQSRLIFWEGLPISESNQPLDDEM